MRNFSFFFGLMAMLLVSAPAMAQVSGFLGVTNDYVARGVSNSYHDQPALQGVVNYDYGNFYIGGFGSTVDFNDGTTSELDVFLGYRPKVGSVTLVFGALIYNYTNDPIPYEFNELKVGASRDFGTTNVATAVYYTDDFFGYAGEGVYYELNVHHPVNDKVSVSGGAGYQALMDDPGDYGTFNVGANYQFTQVLGLGLRYHWTDRSDIGEFYDDRVTATIRASF